MSSIFPAHQRITEWNSYSTSAAVGPGPGGHEQAQASWSGAPRDRAKYDVSSAICSARAARMPRTPSKPIVPESEAAVVGEADVGMDQRERRGAVGRGHRPDEVAGAADQIRVGRAFAGAVPVLELLRGRRPGRRGRT